MSGGKSRQLGWKGEVAGQACGSSPSNLGAHCSHGSLQAPLPGHGTRSGACSRLPAASSECPGPGLGPGAAQPLPGRAHCRQWQPSGARGRHRCGSPSAVRGRRHPFPARPACTRARGSRSTRPGLGAHRRGTRTGRPRCGPLRLHRHRAQRRRQHHPCRLRPVGHRQRLRRLHLLRGGAPRDLCSLSSASDARMLWQELALFCQGSHHPTLQGPTCAATFAALPDSRAPPAGPPAMHASGRRPAGSIHQILRRRHQGVLRPGGRALPAHRLPPDCGHPAGWGGPRGRRLQLCLQLCLQLTSQLHRRPAGRCHSCGARCVEQAWHGEAAARAAAGGSTHSAPRRTSPTRRQNSPPPCHLHRQ